MHTLYFNYLKYKQTIYIFITKFKIYYSDFYDLFIRNEDSEVHPINPITNFDVRTENKEYYK